MHIHIYISLLRSPVSYMVLMEYELLRKLSNQRVSANLPFIHFAQL